MASELEVQTIRGPSGGANANKVLIPSGQTLDASEGFIPPLGHVIQTIYGESSSVTSTTSTSHTSTGLVKPITTKMANSKILVVYDFCVQMNFTNGGTSEVSIFNSLDNYATKLISKAAATYDNHWVMLPNGLQVLHSPNQSAGTTITYDLRMRKTSGSASMYIVDNWNGSSAKQTVVIMEIAQ
jgi:hypothetical protein